METKLLFINLRNSSTSALLMFIGGTEANDVAAQSALAHEQAVLAASLEQPRRLLDRRFLGIANQ